MQAQLLSAFGHEILPGLPGGPPYVPRSVIESALRDAQAAPQRPPTLSESIRLSERLWARWTPWNATMGVVDPSV